tara:strand:+ start:2290 stop:2517 length:228 start_codon:yes stop_codon:yes gene_type:complete
METLSKKVYQDNGYADRDDYLNSLRDTYGTEIVNTFLEIMPPSEDFDGLVTDLEDYTSGDGFYAMMEAELNGGEA